MLCLLTFFIRLFVHVAVIGVVCPRIVIMQIDLKDVTDQNILELLTNRDKTIISV